MSNLPRRAADLPYFTGEEPGIYGFATEGQDGHRVGLIQRLGIGSSLRAGGEGARVTLVGRQEETVREAAGQIEARTGSRPLAVVADITRPQDIERIVAVTVERYGTVDILVNNCGGPAPGTFDEIDDAAWQHGFELTLLSYIRSIRAVLPYMRGQKFGRIVNVTSSAHKEPIENLIVSSTLRVGVLGLAKTLAPELARDNILINTVGPGRFATDRVINWTSWPRRRGRWKSARSRRSSAAAFLSDDTAARRRWGR